MSDLRLEDRVRGALMGAAVGDALGVPFEFKPRAVRMEYPITQMEEYGTYPQPKGTWSDDTSMSLGVAKALTDFAGQELGEDVIKQMTLYFLDWFFKEDFNANGLKFDCGITVGTALRCYPRDYSLRHPLALNGSTGEYEQGNGSLMRLLPLALWHGLHPVSAELMNQASAITHAHPHLLGICAHYMAFVRELVLWAQNHAGEDFPIAELLKAANAAPEVQVQEIPYTPDIDALLATPYEELNGDGYVLFSIQVLYWCLAHGKDFKEATLLAANLGMDTDTNACLVGGLMGFMQGVSGIPEEWLEVLRNKALLNSVYEPFMQKLLQ